MVNDFMASGGDGYPVVTARATTGNVLDQEVADFILTNTPIKPAIQDRSPAWAAAARFRRQSWASHSWSDCGEERELCGYLGQSARRRAGSVNISISTIFPRMTVNLISATGCPRSRMIAPGAPLTRARRTWCPSREPADALWATARAPRINRR